MEMISTRVGFVVFSVCLLTSAGKSEPGKTLKEIMLNMGADLNRVHDGIMAENYDSVAQAAQKIAEHPKPVNAMQILGLLGIFDMPAFKSHDSNVHDLATEISNAAKQKNLEIVLLKTNDLVKACVSCHQNFRDKVVKGLKGN